jgi:hypothetical protein
MSIKKLLSVVLLACMVMLAIGTQSTRALPGHQPPPERVLLLDDGSELVVQKLAAAAAPNSGTIGNNFVIHNDPDSNIKEQRPAVAYNSDRQEYLVVWYNDRPGCDDLRAQRVSKKGTLVGGAFFISAGCDDDRRFPDVAYNSQQKQYLVVWENEHPSNGFSIRGKRISGTGTVLDSNDIEIRGAGGGLYTPVSPAVAYASTADRYLIVWSEVFHPMPITHEILAQVMTSSGTLEGSRVTVSSGTGSSTREDPDLAYNRARNEFLVVWRQYQAAGDRNINAQRVKMAGGMGVLGGPLTICDLPNDDYTPAVAALPHPSGTGQYLVVWQDRPGTTGNILARQVTGDGSSISIYLFVAFASVDEINPAIASNESGQRYFVTWSRPADPPWAFNYIHGRTVSLEGDIGEETYLGGIFADYPAVAAGPLGDFMTVFEDTPLSLTVGIYGQLVGNRIYIPLVLRNY